MTLLHEHFHQWQYSQPNYYAGVAGLNLAHGDTTAQWMLDYPFPYDSAPVRRAMRRLANSLLRALDAKPTARVGAITDVLSARNLLRNRLTAADYRYFEFQLWQEGVARFIEYAAARAGAESGQPSAEFRSLPDYEPYSKAADRARRIVRRELEHLNLGRDRRVAFYPVGAAIAMLLDTTRSDWKQIYTVCPFTLPPLESGIRPRPECR